MAKDWRAGNKWNYRHGHATGYRSRTYRSWLGMLERCTNPKHKHYTRYGGRGIVVCKRWLKFDNFLADMGVRPPGKSIDRIDNNGPYRKSNCKWATRKEQARNSPVTKYLMHNGVTRSMEDWSRYLGLARYGVHDRLKQGWSRARALSTFNRRRK